MMSVFARIGISVLVFLSGVGRMVLFAWQMLRRGFVPPVPWRQLGQQCLDIGFLSLPVVALTSVFSGMVLALQTHVGFARYASERVIPEVVAISTIRELGPVLAGLMVAGRVGAAISAEIGTMRVTEQIDALVTMSVDPHRYLVMPRVVAGVLMLPVLVALADTLGIMGGYLVGIYRLEIAPEAYLMRTIEVIQARDFLLGMVKAASFGGTTALLGCYFGFHAGAGALGVGRATTQAVVAASATILISNYLITEFFF